MQLCLCSFDETLNQNKDFWQVNERSFPKLQASVIDALNCDPIKRMDYFRALFKNPNKKKTKKFNDIIKISK